MTNLVFEDGAGITIASMDDPYPVALDPRSVTTTRTALVERTATIPGIATAAAFANLDQFGQLGSFNGVPTNGIIWDFKFLDADNEGIDKIVWLFRDEIVLAADNAAFSLADIALPSVLGVFQFSTWRTAVNCQVGFTGNVPLRYSLRDPKNDRIYYAAQTLGADNIAAGSLPQLSIVIEAAT